jgi:hypothetical protein
MKIEISNEKGKKIKIDKTDYDTNRTLLEKYAIAADQDALPSFFKLEIIEEEGGTPKYSVKDIRTLLDVLSEEDLADKNYTDSILGQYPELTRGEVGILWVKINFISKKKDVKPATIDTLKTFDKRTFITLGKLQDSVKDFDKQVVKTRVLLTAKIERENAQTQILEKVEGVPIDEFDLEGIRLDVKLKLPNGDGLVDIFDSFDVSKEIPFMMLRLKGKIYYKVFKHIIPLDNWIDPVVGKKAGVLRDGIYFKILNVVSGKSKRLFENIYSDGFWGLDNILELTIDTTSGITADQILERVLEALGDRIESEVLYKRQDWIKGVFAIPNLKFNKVILSDLIFTNPTLRYFLFLNEREQSILQKSDASSYVVYFSPDQKGIIGNSVTLHMGAFSKGELLEDGKDARVKVRISRAENIQDANSTRLVLSKLLTIYLNEYEKIEKIYSGIIPSFKHVVTVKKKVEKEDKKTGKRTKILRNYDPSLFRANYPTQCQQHQQPYVLTEEEATELIKATGDPHKVMFYEGTWYACDPREPNDKDQRHIWPGLKENKPKVDTKYKDEHPYLPCCYVKDQYKSGRLAKYLSSSQDQAPEKITKASGLSYIKTSNKKIDAGVYAKMPYNWERVFRQLNMDKIRRGKHDIYPILRHGVLDGPDSFFHCLAEAFDKDGEYAGKTEQEKRDYVYEIRKEIAENVNLNIGRQELYDYTDKEIRDMLLDPFQYIAPEMFVSLAQKHYDVNIFIFSVKTALTTLVGDKENEIEGGEDCDIVIPRALHGYLAKDIDSARDTVIILKYTSGDPSYPFQCEIAVEFEISGKKAKNVSYVMKSKGIVEKIIKMFYDSNEIYVVEPDSASTIYRPVQEIF